MWETVLLQQFHDILPGFVDRVGAPAGGGELRAGRVGSERLIAAALAALAGDGEARVSFNAAPVAADGVPALGACGRRGGRDSSSLVADDDGWILDNGVVRARFDAAGDLVSFVEVSSGREVLAAAAGGLQLFRDTPNQWDAWDVDAHYQRTPLPLGAATSVSVGG